MRNAPLVMYPVGRFSWAFALCATLWVTSAVVTVFFVQQQHAFGRVLFSCSILLVAGVALVKGWMSQSSQRWLLWDGQNWQWSPDAEGAAWHPISGVDAQLDFQCALLLRLRRPQSIGHASHLQEWVWLYKGFAPGLWHAIRCAVYSRQR